MQPAAQGEAEAGPTALRVPVRADERPHVDHPARHRQEVAGRDALAAEAGTGV